MFLNLLLGAVKDDSVGITKGQLEVIALLLVVVILLLWLIRGGVGRWRR